MTMAGVKWFNIWVLTCMYNDHLKTKCANMAKVANLLLNANFNSLSQKIECVSLERSSVGHQYQHN